MEPSKRKHILTVVAVNGGMAAIAVAFLFILPEREHPGTLLGLGLALVALNVLMWFSRVEELRERERR